MKISTFLKIALKSLTPLICLVTFIAALLLFLSFKNRLVFSDEARVYVRNPAIDTFDGRVDNFYEVYRKISVDNEDDRLAALAIISEMKFFRPNYIAGLPISYSSHAFFVYDRGIVYSIHAQQPSYNDTSDAQYINWTVDCSYIQEWHDGNLPANRIGGGNVNRNKKRGVFTLDEDTARNAVEFIKNVEGTLVHEYTRD